MDAANAVLIAGAGGMGRELAELMARRGFEVQLWDHAPRQLGQASAAIERSLVAQADRGLISDRDLDLTLSRIRLISDLRIVHPATPHMIEAVVEDIAVKSEVLLKIEKLLPRCWFVSATEGLSIAGLGAALERPERLVGMRFFDSAVETPLVEVVYSIRTDEEWLGRAVELVEQRLAKQAIVVRDLPGLVAPRLALSMGLEAMRMVEQGLASVEDIDRAMELGYGHPVGPLRRADCTGLDVCLNTARFLRDELGASVFSAPRILEELVEAGKLGRKSGEGFYKWPARNGKLLVNDKS